jgi:hypothetical protein
VPVITETRHNYFLGLHLMLAKFAAFPIDPPVVPKGTSRVRLVFKATNTEEEVKLLADTICEWAKEMIEIKQTGKEGGLPTAARQVFTWMAVVGETNQVNGAKDAKETNGVKETNESSASNGASATSGIILVGK